jgi:myo-inositol catabolism protein IolC
MVISLLLAGCAAVSGPEAAGGRDSAAAMPESTNLVLYVSNQSFADDPVGIRVEIDGRVVVDGVFAVDSQHTWIEYPLTLPAGTHPVRATSTTGVVSTHDLVLPEDETRWAVLEYWHYPDDTPRSFTFHISDRPVGFD